MSGWAYAPTALRIDRLALASELQAIADRVELEAVMWAPLLSDVDGIERAARQLARLARTLADPMLDPDLDVARAFAASGAVTADALGAARRFLSS